MITKVVYRLPTDSPFEIERSTTFDHGVLLADLKPEEIAEALAEALVAVARTIGPALWLRIETTVPSSEAARR